MSLKNYGCSVYVSPVGEELQIEDFGTSVSYHTDAYLLVKLSQLNLSQNMQDLIVSRFQEYKDFLPPELSEQVNKLSDEEKIKQTDSRYQQFLSDRSQKIMHLLSDFDSAQKKVEDTLRKQELTDLEVGLRDLVKRYNSYDV